MILNAFQKLFRRRTAYRQLFLLDNGSPNPNAARVLADLKRFCKAQTSTVYVSPISKTIDPLAMAMAEGRREVWNRIQSHLQISDQEISRLVEPEE